MEDQKKSFRQKGHLDFCQNQGVLFCAQSEKGDCMLDYFYGGQAELFSFYRLPKVLFTDPKFRGLSAESKILYGLLLDRMSLSIKSGWLDIPVKKIPTVWSKGYGISVTAKPASKRTAMARRATRPTFWTASSTNWCVRSLQR